MDMKLIDDRLDRIETDVDTLRLAMGPVNADAVRNYIREIRRELET